MGCRQFDRGGDLAGAMSTGIFGPQMFEDKQGGRTVIELLGLLFADLVPLLTTIGGQAFSAIGQVVQHEGFVAGWRAIHDGHDRGFCEPPEQIREILRGR